jgi:hypothetical protein
MERLRYKGYKKNFKTYSTQENISLLSNLRTASEFRPILSTIGTGIGQRNSESCEMKEGRSQESGLPLHGAGSKFRTWMRRKISLHNYDSASAIFQAKWRFSKKNEKLKQRVSQGELAKEQNERLRGVLISLQQEIIRYMTPEQSSRLLLMIEEHAAIPLNGNS